MLRSVLRVCCVLEDDLLYHSSQKSCYVRRRVFPGVLFELLDHRLQLRIELLVALTVLGCALHSQPDEFHTTTCKIRSLTSTTSATCRNSPTAAWRGGKTAEHSLSTCSAALSPLRAFAPAFLAARARLLLAPEGRAVGGGWPGLGAGWSEIAACWDPVGCCGASDGFGAREGAGSGSGSPGAA